MALLLCFFKQNTAYELRISDWSSDVCSSDLSIRHILAGSAPMDDEGFRHYLENDYSGSLSAKAVGDVISRCRRIEAAFNVDLSHGSDIEHLVKRHGRSEERRVGTECVSPFRSRCAPGH